MSDYNALVAAIEANLDDQAPKLILADWFDNNGEPEKGLALRRQIAAKNESEVFIMTEDEFKKGIVGQDDDNDYEESGYVAVVIEDKAYIGSYSHCSCYSTFTSLCGGGVSDSYNEGWPKWDWCGTPSELVEMAMRTADPALPFRTASPDDYNYDHLLAMYKQVIEWNGSTRNDPKQHAEPRKATP